MLLHKAFLDARVKLGFCGILKNLKRVWRGSIKWWWWPRVDRLWSSLCSAESVGKTMTRGKATSMVSNISRIWRSFSARLERWFKMFDYIYGGSSIAGPRTASRQKKLVLILRSGHGREREFVCSGSVWSAGRHFFFLFFNIKWLWMLLTWCYNVVCSDV